MKRFLILLVIFSWLSLAAVAQTQAQVDSFASVPRHALLVESSWFVLSNSILFHSIGYEYEYWRSKRGRMQMGVRAGAGIIQDIPDAWVSGLWVPVVNRFSFGANAHRFEAVLGASFLTSIFLPVFPVVQLGYRYQPPERGMIWRVHVGVTGLGGSVGWAF